MDHDKSFEVLLNSICEIWRTKFQRTQPKFGIGKQI